MPGGLARLASRWVLSSVSGVRVDIWSVYPYTDQMNIDLTISERTGVPLYRQLQDQLTMRIRGEELPGGTMLPSVRLLAAQLRVSAITVRRAYAELEAAGLLERRQGRGTFVVERVPPPADAVLSDASTAVRAAVHHARSVGLSHDDIVELVHEALNERASA